MFQGLLSQKDVIEQKLGFTLDWQELPDADSCRIAVWRTNSPLADETQWEIFIDGSSRS